jgi:hypothetical protein
MMIFLLHLKEAGRVLFFCSAGPFLLGVILACYQSQKSNRAGHLPAPRTIVIIFGYLVSLVVMAVAVFSPWW